MKRIPLAPLALIALLVTCHDLAAQKKGGGTTPPPNPAIAFADYGIKVMNADGSNVRTVVALGNGDSASYPSWSPDGQQLAFCGVLGGQRGIWRVNLDGSGRLLLAPQDGAALSPPDWSRVPAPDGRHKIAFRSTGVGGDSDVFVVNTDGTGLQNLTSSLVGEEDPCWTRDATGIYVGWIQWTEPYAFGASRLVLGPRSGGGIEVLASPLMLDEWWFLDCQVSHGSDLILFRGGPGHMPSTSIWVVDASVLPWTPQLLYGDGQVQMAPSFSPDDGRIVLQRNGRGQTAGIFTANLDASGPVRIYGGTGRAPRWKHN